MINEGILDSKSYKIICFSFKKEISISKSEKDMLNHIQTYQILNYLFYHCFYFYISMQIIFLKKIKINSSKDDDINPNKKFIDNLFFKFFLSDKSLISKLEKYNLFWNNNDHDIIRKIFKDIVKHDLYSDYLKCNDINYNVDIKFFNNILNDVILNNQVLHHILEEKSIYWIDDLPFVATIIMGELKEKKIKTSRTVFKNSSDKDFAVDLFRKTIKFDKQFEEIIIVKANNWDLDRIAIMDQIMIKWLSQRF